MEVFFCTTSRSRSLGMVIKVSTLALRPSAARSATSLRRTPSKLNGLVTMPIVSAPSSFAISATTGAAPEPVPPPRPAVMKTLAESRSASAIFSVSSSAALLPTFESPPAPRPLVILSPMRILWGASDWSSACASVLQAMNSTPIISARIIRLTALLPPPPTPMTRMSAKFSESDRSGIAYPPGGSPAEVVVRSGPPEMCVEEARDGAGSDADSIPRNRPRSPAARALKPLSGDLSTSRSRPWRSATSAREKAEAHFPDRVVGVRIEQCDRLPRPESEPAGDHGYCQRGRGQERQDVVGAVALRAVAVHPAVVPREHPVEARHQVGLRPGAEFHDDQTGGMRHEHGEKPISLTGDEPGALLGQVVQAASPPRPDRQAGRLHRREEAPYRVANTGKTPHRRRRLNPGRLARRKTPGAPVEQAYGGAVGRIHDVVGQTQDARGTGHADRHVQDLTSQGRGAGQLARSAGEDHASRQEAVARRTDLGPQHLEVLAHARLDDPADLEAAHRPAGGLAQPRGGARFVVGDCLEGARDRKST